MTAANSTPTKPVHATAGLPVFVISLPRSKRRPIITGRLAQLRIPFRFVDAIHGSTLNDETIADIYDDARMRRRMGRSLTRNEIGCALSHREAYRQIIATGCEAAIILEDDALVTPALNMLLADWRQIPEAIDLISLFKGSGIIHRRGGYKFHHIEFARAASTIECSCSYFIRRRTAIALYKQTEIISTVADWPFDIRQVNHYVTVPDIAIHDHALASEIGEDRPGFIAPPPAFRRKLLGLQAVLFITYFKNREGYDSLYNYYERELRVRLKARMPWRYKILQGYYRWPDKTNATPPRNEVQPASQRSA